MARVQVLHTVDDGAGPDHWRLCLQWCRYIYDDADREPQNGYRFIWRRPTDEGGGLQAARGQARIPSRKAADELWKKAEDAGWDNREG